MCRVIRDRKAFEHLRDLADEGDPQRLAYNDAVYRYLASVWALQCGDDPSCALLFEHERQALMAFNRQRLVSMDQERELEGAESWLFNTIYGMLMIQEAIRTGRVDADTGHFDWLNAFGDFTAAKEFCWGMTVPKTINRPLTEAFKEFSARLHV
eukprot:TRINITY_DN10574_c0_g1_i1.p2 TRINITY_DN10574_c0_g1~~TRINITY_DN10574_c0_g1_i1.p2  ORF type:complete len:154 (-),score=18.59 TRINITY_DN10574_c0_g1_i1:154-615(-)